MALGSPVACLSLQHICSPVDSPLFREKGIRFIIHRTFRATRRCVNVLGQRVMKSDTSVLCDGPTHADRKSLGAIAALLYGVGIPALFALVLAPHRCRFPSPCVYASGAHAWHACLSALGCVDGCPCLCSLAQPALLAYNRVACE